GAAAKGEWPRRRSRPASRRTVGPARSTARGNVARVRSRRRAGRRRAGRRPAATAARPRGEATGAGGQPRARILSKHASAREDGPTSTATAAWLRGVPEKELEELAERIFARAIAAAIYPESRTLVQAHRRRGHTLALVSSATRYQVEPLARELGIPHVLCTRLEVENGRLTGRHVWPTCYGGGKALAARALAREQGVELRQSYFYTDSDEDLPLLEIVGRARPTNPSRRLAAIARRRG